MHILYGVVGGFLERLGEFDAALATCERRDDSLLFAAVDELLARIARGDPPGAGLDAGAPV